MAVPIWEPTVGQSAIDPLTFQRVIVGQLGLGKCHATQWPAGEVTYVAGFHRVFIASWTPLGLIIRSLHALMLHAEKAYIFGGELKVRIPVNRTLLHIQ